MHSGKRALTLALALAAYTGILVWNCWRVGITVDEPTRLLGGQLYWMGLDDHPPKDQPPLLSLAVGWAPRLLDIPLYRDHEIWKKARKDHVYAYILDRVPGPQIQRLFFLARLGVIVFPLLTALLLFHWSRQLFSGGTALLVLLLFLLLPSARAHGALITSDMAAAFTYLLAGYRAWRYWGCPDWRNTVWLGLAAGLAAIAKFSLLIVPPLACAAVLLGMLKPGRQARWLYPLQAAAVAVLSLLVVNTAYRFDVRRLTGGEIDEIRRFEEFPPVVMAALPVMKVIPTPREMQQGIRSLGRENRDGHPVFLAGRIYRHGHWAYFPLCLAVKPPIGFQVLVVAGLALLALGLIRRRLPPDRLFLLIPPLIYFAFATQSAVQLGIRLILPTVVYLVLIAGLALESLRQPRWGGWLVASLFAVIIASTARVFPQDMAYFNEWAGGPENGWRYLADSNIDWGHNLPELKDYLERHGIRRIKYFQFGFDKIHRYFPGGELEFQPQPWDPAFVSWVIFRPAPGLYAVHVSLLPGQYYPRGYEDYLRYFRGRRPDARVAYGIFVYSVP